jgi:vanadium chloroperoxidase
MALPILPPVIESGTARNYRANYVLYWNDVALDLVRITHTVSGFQSGPPLSARFLGILHLAMHDAYFDVFAYTDHAARKTEFDGSFAPYMSTALKPAKPTTLLSTAANAKDAVAGASITVLNKLFKSPDKRDAGVSLSAAAALGQFVDTSVQAYEEANLLDTRSQAFLHGVAIARSVLGQFEVKGSDPGADGRDYAPNSNHPYWFDDDPVHPVRLRPVDPNNAGQGDKATRPYHGPFYGTTATVLATTTDIQIADPPVNPHTPPAATSTSPEYLDYLESLEDVHRMGGIEELPTTKRRPAQTAGGLFWAYDGVGLIGTPPRLYNQIVRQIAFDATENNGSTADQKNAEYVRLLALVNVAMADAGIFAWRDKYKYELWRPLSGVRADPTGPVPDGFGRPTWKVLGAPATNSNEGGFKPPFPAYPSGHATFGAAAFHMVRLFYNQRGDKKLGQVTTPGENNFQVVDENTQQPTGQWDPPVDLKVADDPIKFSFISDELNGISRTLYQPYNPSRRIEDQPGDVRTRMTFTFNSMKEAIFSNAISRIWLGVHWHFDGFAGNTIHEGYVSPDDITKDKNVPRPNRYVQKFQVEKDGSTKYKAVAGMDWFAANSLGPRDGAGSFPVGGVPLGMMIAENIFNNNMRSTGSLTDLGANIGTPRS